VEFYFRNKKIDIEGLSSDDHIYKKILENNAFYEIDLLEYIRNIMTYENSVCIDVGGNIGNHSIFFGGYVANQVITIEPNTQVIHVLKKNLTKNKTNFSLYECAAGASDSFGQVIMPENYKSNIGMAKVKEIKTETEDSFQIKTLDSIFQEWLDKKPEFNGKLTFIKIDVEGMEMDVLRGANIILKKYKPDLFVEAATEKHFLKINNYLMGFGYSKLSKWADTPVYHFSCKPSIIMRYKIFLYKTKLHYWSFMHKK